MKSEQSKKLCIPKYGVSFLKYFFSVGWQFFSRLPKNRKTYGCLENRVFTQNHYFKKKCKTDYRKPAIFSRGSRQLSRQIFLKVNFKTTKPSTFFKIFCQNRLTLTEYFSKNRTNRVTLNRVKVSTVRVIKCFSRESSWKPKTQQNDSREAVWLSF